jgi:hypothetical protein
LNDAFQICAWQQLTPGDRDEVAEIAEANGVAMLKLASWL